MFWLISMFQESNHQYLEVKSEFHTISNKPNQPTNQQGFEVCCNFCFINFKEIICFLAQSYISVVNL